MDRSLGVGSRALDVTDAEQPAVIPVRLFYPTRSSSRMETFGPYAIEVALDGSLDAAGHPLVVISHGSGGSPWLYRDLAMYLARAGERDAQAPSAFADIVVRGVRHLDHRIIPNAGHFSFASPFPPAMTSPTFPPSQDPPGFDRAALQRSCTPRSRASCGQTSSTREPPVPLPADPRSSSVSSSRPSTARVPSGA